MWEDWTTAPWPAKEVLESCEEIRVLERKLSASGQHEVCQLRPWQAGSKVSKFEGFFFFPQPPWLSEAIQGKAGALLLSPQHLCDAVFPSMQNIRAT